MKTKHKLGYGLAAILLAGVLSIGVLGCKTAPINTANGFIQSDTNGVLYLAGHPIPPAPAAAPPLTTPFKLPSGLVKPSAQ